MNFQIKRIFLPQVLYPTILDNQLNCKNNDLHLSDVAGGRIDIIIGEITQIQELLGPQNFDVVIHLGANAYVGESIAEPEKYFGLNVSSTYRLAKYCKSMNVKKVIFSSTCAVYGNYERQITEQTRLLPESPYGYSKLFCENVLRNELGSDCVLTIFRFFNVAGANTNFSGGEVHTKETHLIPVIFDCALHNKELIIFGGDYNTPDGTCLREYVHVTDIVGAHLLAIEKNTHGIFNLGCSKPTSNLEVLFEIERKLQIKVNYSIKDRRSGDAVSLHSSNEKATTELGWLPANSNLETIIDDYFNWLKLRKNQ